MPDFRQTKEKQAVFSLEYEREREEERENRGPECNFLTSMDVCICFWRLACNLALLSRPC